MNIVLVGECGTGKSSLINLIAGRNAAMTSNSATACTTEVRAYKVAFEGCVAKLWDTPGFNEGSVPRTSANNRSLGVLVQSLNQFVSEEEIHLLIYCINGSRARAAHLKHYKTIRAFLPYKVPMVAVVTRLERYQNRMDDWWSTNVQELASLGMNFADHACVTSIPDSHGLCPSFRERRFHSQKALRDLIIRNHPSQSSPVQFPTVPISTSAVSDQKGVGEISLRGMSILTTSRRVRVPIRLRRLSTSLVV